MIPTPKLDDRTYADIIAEAIRLIPRYCPEWTNHNPTDPGITILELCSFMTEMILDRLNRVPEKNYLAFLDMLGVSLQPAQPAHALLTFQLADGAADRSVMLRKGLQVSTPQSDEDDAVVFETTRDLTLLISKLDRCFSYFDESYSDNSPFLKGDRADGFLAFSGAERIDRFIYLGDDRLGNLGDSAVLRLFISAPEHGGRDLARLLEWEYYNGRRWRDLRAAKMDVERGEVIFLGQSDMRPYKIVDKVNDKINGLETVWIRGRLAEVPKDPTQTEVDTAKAVIEVVGEGLPPEQAFANTDNGQFLALDLGKNVHPFGKEPRVDHCLYLGSREVLSQENTDVEIEFQLSDPGVVPPPEASPDLLLSWEYFDGKKWRILGKSAPDAARGKLSGDTNEFNFVDGTAAFTRTGVVRFSRPKDLKECKVTGEPSFWVRVRIQAGDYGLQGAYTLDEDKWVWREERPLRPPAFKSIGLRYRTDLSHVRYFLSHNDFRYRDHSEDAKSEYRPFQPFQAIPDEGAALYLGFSAKLPNELISLYVQLCESSATAPELDYAHAEHLSAYYRKRDALWEAEQRIVWEFFNGKAWEQLPVNDGTKNFAESGFIDFLGPDTADKCLRFTEDRYWVRARLETGGYVKPPRIRRILQNTVEAKNTRTIYREVLGASDGTPQQSFTLLHGPLLDGEIIEVREREEPKTDELSDLGEGPVRPAAPDDKDGGFLVRYRAVESFFESGPRARHYLKDPHTRQIFFGDGIHGMVPPQGRNAVIAREYKIGGGSRGNVNAGMLTTLTRAVAHVDGVFNVLPAVGGADEETVAEAKLRAPMQLKSRDRAVTAEDFETLALRSSTSIARARCLAAEEQTGHVLLLIVPRGDDKSLDLTRKLLPPPELCRFVKNYLDDRRLITTIVDVEKPRYVEVSLKVTLIRRTVGQSERLRADIEQRLRRYLHPVVGGLEGQGWPFGRPIYRTDLVHLVEDIPGVEAIDAIGIYDEDRRVWVENVRLRSDELPHVVHITVVERVRQEMV